jgi:uncharacterized protein (DUF1330 family)
MPAYVIVEIEIHDPVLYKSYTMLTPQTIANYKGKFLVRGGESIILEGDKSPKRVVVLEFPSLEIANSWWHSQEYSKARKIRQQAATTRMTIVDGI